MNEKIQESANIAKLLLLPGLDNNRSSLLQVRNNSLALFADS